MTGRRAVFRYAVVNLRKKLCVTTRQSIQLSEFRSLDKRMCGITPDKTDQNKPVLICQVWA